MFKSIQFKLLGSVGLVFVLAFAGSLLLARNALVTSTDFTRERMETSLIDVVEMQLTSVAQGAALEVQSFLKQAMTTTDTLGTIVQETSVGNGGTPMDRDLLKELNRLALVANDSISAAYTQFEPNGYDNRDSANRGNLAHSSNAGTIEIYWVREDGDLVFYETEDADEKYADEMDELGIREMEWYLCSMDRKRACLLDPYLYEINETLEILMTTYSYAVTDSQGFNGIVGIDINLPVIQERIVQSNQSSIDGAGDIMILSQRQLLVASTRYPDQLGNQLSEVDPDLAQAISAGGLIRDKGRWLVSIPIQFAGVDDSWQVVYSLPEAVILDQIEELKTEVGAKSQQTLGLMSFAMIVALAIILLGLLWLIRTVINPISTISSMMQELATNEGDLSQTLPVQRHQELSDLADGFNAFAAKLREMISSLMIEKDHLLGVSSEMKVNGQRVSEQSNFQTEQLDSIVTAITEMAASANEVASLASTTASAATESNDLIKQSQTALRDNRDTIEALDGELTRSSEQVGRVAEQSQAIYSILNTIRTIAEQTNLLALNAAIEAARAGEQGRGFAVVADEVRSLASRTQQSTEEVDQLIQSLQKEVDSAVTLLDSSRERMSASVKGSELAFDSLTQAVTQVKQITDDATQVASAATEQSSVSDDISRMVTEVGDAAAQLAESARITSDLTEQTEAGAQKMNAQLSRLKI